MGQISRYTDYSHVVYQRKDHGKRNTVQGQIYNIQIHGGGGDRGEWVGGVSDCV